MVYENMAIGIVTLGATSILLYFACLICLYKYMQIRKFIFREHLEKRFLEYKHADDKI